MNSIKLLLYPHTVTLDWVRKGSPEIVRSIEMRDFALKVVRWDGKVQSLPEEPCLVHASHLIPYPIGILAHACREQRHLLFYGNGVMTSNNFFESRAREQEINRFLVDFLKYSILPKELRDARTHGRPPKH